MKEEVSFYEGFQQLIDPQCVISPGAMVVNGISNEMVADQSGINKTCRLDRIASYRKA